MEQKKKCYKIEILEFWLKWLSKKNCEEDTVARRAIYHEHSSEMIILKFLQKPSAHDASLVY